MGADCKSVAQATKVRILHLPLEGAGSDGIQRLLYVAFAAIEENTLGVVLLNNLRAYGEKQGLPQVRLTFYSGKGVHHGIYSLDLIHRAGNKWNSANR